LFSATVAANIRDLADYAVDLIGRLEADDYSCGLFEVFQDLSLYKGELTEILSQPTAVFFESIQGFTVFAQSLSSFAAVVHGTSLLENIPSDLAQNLQLSFPTFPTTKGKVATLDLSEIGSAGSAQAVFTDKAFIVASGYDIDELSQAKLETTDTLINFSINTALIEPQAPKLAVSLSTTDVALKLTLITRF
jgi:hypothetical protein